MIPLQLSLRNFMCYRELPPLSFRGIHLACLCGDNGHGKSALLDAITWALWGQARGKGDDELIHLGEAEMEVDFEFQAGQERYRALRKRSRGRRPGQPGQSLLDLQVAADPPEAGFRSIAGNSLRETEQKIADVLHMDYKTFINSAFLLQGRADEFTTKSPGDRKEVLAHILDLSFYDRLEEMARERQRLRAGAEDWLRLELEAIDRKLSHKEEYQAELGRAQTALEVLEAQRRGREEVVAGLRQRKMALELQAGELAQVEAQAEREERDRSYWEAQVRERHRRIEGFQAVLAGRQEIQAGYSELTSLRKADEVFNRSLRQLMALSGRRVELERAVERARNDLVAEERLAQSDLERLGAAAAREEPARGELAQILELLEGLVGREEELSQKRQQLQQLAGEAQLLRSLNGQLKEEMQGLRGKLDMLSQDEARCPLCGQELGDAERSRLLAQYQAEGHARAEAFRSNDGAIREKEMARRSLEAEVAGLESTLSRDRARAQAQVVALEKEVAEAEKARRQFQERRHQRDEVLARLATGDFALPEQAALRGVEDEIADLGYDEGKHGRVRARLGELAPYEEKHQHLAEAERTLPEEEAALHQAQSQVARWQASLEALARKREALMQGLEALPQVTQQLVAEEGALMGLLAQREEAQRRLWDAQQRVESCLALEGERGQKEQELEQAAREKGIYEELTLAFGKRGVQALIIESVLPEMEERANRLLSRMSDGRMLLRLEAQRPRKAGKGEPIETLDILISDELGTRSYEMYSGGEAFRINLALRIALSQLLARRAGAPLPTLIIDEGFGTQDASGREKLVEAITSIQDDFEKILVVTHIEELKDAFPVRLEVTKTERGSTVVIT